MFHMVGSLGAELHCESRSSGPTPPFCAGRAQRRLIHVDRKWPDRNQSTCLGLPVTPWQARTG
jgi:hypothetical protein